MSQQEQELYKKLKKASKLIFSLYTKSLELHPDYKNKTRLHIITILIIYNILFDGGDDDGSDKKARMLRLLEDLLNDNDNDNSDEIGKIIEIAKKMQLQKTKLTVNSINNIIRMLDSPIQVVRYDSIAPFYHVSPKPAANPAAAAMERFQMSPGTNISQFRARVDRVKLASAMKRVEIESRVETKKTFDTSKLLFMKTMLAKNNELALLNKKGYINGKEPVYELLRALNKDNDLVIGGVVMGDKLVGEKAVITDSEQKKRIIGLIKKNKKNDIH